MSETRELQVYRDEESGLPATAVQMATIDPTRTAAQLANVQKFFDQVMKSGVHYGTIPGVDKPFLWKGGAELLAGLFGYGVRTRRDEMLSHVDRGAERVEITIKATVFSRATGADQWEAEGFASSAESCFRRKACPTCSKNTGRDRQSDVRDQFVCYSCGWKGPEAQTIDALANDFGTTIRNVAARAEKRAKVRSIAEATGITAILLVPRSAEEEEEAHTGNGGISVTCPKCGKGHLVEKQRRDGSGSFWVCSGGHYDAKTKTRSGCQYTQNEPPAAAAPKDAAPVPEPEASPEVEELVADVHRAIAERGAQTPGQAMLMIQPFLRGAKVSLAKGFGDLPTLGAGLLGELLAWVQALKGGEGGAA